MPKKSEIKANQVKQLQQRLQAVQQELQEKKRQASDYLEGWKRERAAFENFKKELSKRQQLVEQDITSQLVEKLLPILDAFEQAEKNLKAEQLEDGWVKGILQIKTQLKGALQELGVEEIEVKEGEEFDPRYQEAVGGTGSVIEKVFQPGFRLGDRIIRPAKVILRDKKGKKQA